MQCLFNEKRLGRWSSLLLCFALLLGLLTANGNAISQVTAQLRPDFTIIIDGSQRTFYNAGGQEIQPILCSGTTYLPVRAIGEIMGKNVDWNQTTKTVTLSGVRTAAVTAGTPDSTAAVQDITAELRDDFTVVVDGAVRTFADAGGNRVYPLLYQGSTYLPIRAIGELMGKTVGWDQATKTVTLEAGSLVTDADTFSGGGTAPVTPSVPNSPGTAALSLEDAKAIALTHAGLTANQVTFTKQKLDRDDGQDIYEIEFTTADGGKYEYEIRAADGAIIDFESNLKPTTGTSGTVIGMERAKELALEQVSGATASCFSECKLDRENGHLCYEIELVYNSVKYEFKIDAATGTFLSAESEAVHHHH